MFKFDFFEYFEVGEKHLKKKYQVNRISHTKLFVEKTITFMFKIKCIRLIVRVDTPLCITQQYCSDVYTK